MRLLLDTHVLLWATGQHFELSEKARDAISANAAVVFVSVASLWELKIKETLGKVVLPKHFYGALQEGGFEILTIQLSHVQTLGSLPLFHRDPFDRMLVAQAKTEGLTLVTRDPKLGRYPVSLLEA